MRWHSGQKCALIPGVSSPQAWLTRPDHGPRLPLGGRGPPCPSRAGSRLSLGSVGVERARGCRADRGTCGLPGVFCVGSRPSAGNPVPGPGRPQPGPTARFHGKRRATRVPLKAIGVRLACLAPARRGRAVTGRLVLLPHTQWVVIDPSHRHSACRPGVPAYGIGQVPELEPSRWT